MSRDHAPRVLVLAARQNGLLFACIANSLRFRQYLFVSVKEQVLQAINRLPDDIDYRDAAEEIALLAAVREAEHDIEEGRVVTNEQMKPRISEWSSR